SCAPRLGGVETEHYAALFKALGHPVRLRLLDLISQSNGRLCSCDLEPYFDLTQPTLSHHLKTLREAGLLHAEPAGVYILYTLNRPLLASAQGVLMLLANSGR
ncbi:MAG: ArsR/SmtB family transcription factor, partial [Caldilineaceae bacterium]